MAFSLNAFHRATHHNCHDTLERRLKRSISSPEGQRSIPTLRHMLKNGIDQKRLELLTSRIRMDIDLGLLPSAQFAAAKDGELVLSETYGDATPQHRYILQSVSRSILGPTIWKLIGEGRLKCAQKVADIIPEFGTNGKDVVTVEHVLSHTGGFPLAPLGFPAMLERDARLEAFSRWRLTSTPGSQFEYHLTSAAWVLAELVERVSGLTLGEYLRTELCEPLGLSIQVGVPIEDQARTIAMPVLIDETDSDEIDPWGPWFTARPQVLAAGEPSHSIVGSAADVALWLQAVNSSEHWDRAAVEDGIRVRVSQVPDGQYANTEHVNMALFVAVAGRTGGAYLPLTASPTTWGHGGANSQIAFMDPEHGLSFAFLTNGYPAAGYDETRIGINRRTLIANMAGDLVP
jgi:CubicO group peptidase (beta-lactamase class C family)